MKPRRKSGGWWSVAGGWWLVLPSHLTSDTQHLLFFFVLFVIFVVKIFFLKSIKKLATPAHKILIEWIVNRNGGLTGSISPESSLISDSSAMLS